MKYVYNRNGSTRTADLISEDAKFKTVLLQYEDGKTTSISLATFKRWWKPISEEVDAEDKYVEEVMQQKKELGIECPKIDSVEIVSEDMCADGRSYAEIGKEIAKQAKEKANAVKAKKSKPAKKTATKAETSTARDNAKEEFCSLVTEEHSIKEWNPFYFALRKNGKPIAEIRILRDGKFTVYCKEASYAGTKFENSFTIINNFYLPAVVKGVSLEDISFLFTL